MTKRIKIFAILLSVLLVVGLVGAIGVTAAIWTEDEGKEALDASVDVDWTVWAKYFDYETVDGGIVITKFKTQTENGAQIETGFNSPILIIPRSIDEKTVVGISGSVFSDAVLKEMVEELRIPNTVTSISASAFAGFVNLKRVVFETGCNCTVGDFALAGTRKLAGIYVGDAPVSLSLSDGKYVYDGDDTTNLTFAENAFFGSAYAPLSVTP